MRFLVLLATLVAAIAATAAPPDARTLDRGSDLAYRRALGPAADKRQLNANPAATGRARRIANRLAVSAGTMDAESKRYAWAVNLVPGAEPDIRVYPGGRAIVTEALLAATGLNDEEIGAIVAHAFAHSLLGHEAQRIRVPERTESADPNRIEVDVAEATADVMRNLRYTAAEIAAADRASVEMLARAAYDPRAAGSAWRRLGVGGKGIIERAPASEDRLAALDAAIRAAVPLYEATRAQAESTLKAQQLRPQPRVSGPSSGGPGAR